MKHRFRVRYWVVTCILSFFFDLVEKNLLIVKKNFCVAKMASTVYETDNWCSAASVAKSDAGMGLLSRGFYMTVAS